MALSFHCSKFESRTLLKPFKILRALRTPSNTFEHLQTPSNFFELLRTLNIPKSNRLLLPLLSPLSGGHPVAGRQARGLRQGHRRHGHREEGRVVRHAEWLDHEEAGDRRLRSAVDAPSKTITHRIACSIESVPGTGPRSGSRSGHRIHHTHSSFLFQMFIVQVLFQDSKPLHRSGYIRI